MESCQPTPKMHFCDNRGGRGQRIYQILSAALLIVGLLCTASTAWAVAIPPETEKPDATITADNHYALYVGNADGSILNFVGRNEPGAIGNPGEYNWSLPETFFNINIPGGWYIYVVAWDGPPTTSPQMWIGQFSLPDSSMLYSNTTDWFYTPGSGANPLDTGVLPNSATIQSDIASATWTSPLASAPNGTGPWGSIPGFDPSAQFIWADNLGGASNFDDTYVIFRSKAAVVPIPGSVLLLGTGLLGLGLLGLRRKSS